MFDVHRAVHHNTDATVKPTRCTNVSNLFNFKMTLYMFRMVFLSIISLLASRQQYLFDIRSLELLMMDGKTV